MSTQKSQGQESGSPAQKAVNVFAATEPLTLCFFGKTEHVLTFLSTKY